MNQKSLAYLVFDYSEDEHGIGNWDAMASVPSDRVSAVLAEIQAILDWAGEQFAATQGPIDEGADWDFDLQAQDDDGQALPIHLSTEQAPLRVEPAASGLTTLTFSLAGSNQFSTAFQAEFDVSA